LLHSLWHDQGIAQNNVSWTVSSVKSRESKGTAMAKVILALKNRVLKEYSLQKTSIPIGRQWDNSIVLDDPNVSGYHAKMDRMGPDYILTDLQSTNGTLVNGKKIVSHKLTHGDNISIGEHSLLFIASGKTMVDAEEENPLGKTVIMTKPQMRAEPMQVQTSRPSPSRTPAPRRRPSKARPVLLAVIVLIIGGGLFLTYESIFMKGLSPPLERPFKESYPVVIPEQKETPPEVAESIIREPVPLPSEQLVPETEDESSSFKLEMIAWSENAKSRFAVVNGRIVRIGTAIEGAFVEEIGKAHVALRSEEQQWKIRIADE
jgi:pSer/pThr/pTyr-binding forkhead associated (FHA) protein